VNTAVVEMNIASRRISNPPLWEDHLNQGRHGMLHDGLGIKSSRWKPLTPETAVNINLAVPIAGFAL
jgi:hypothetical protein